MRIRSYTLEDLPSVKSLADSTIEPGYYSVAELEAIYYRSQKNGYQCTLVLEDAKHRIRGVRITFPPGHWQQGKGRGLAPERWGVAFTDAAYFQSLFIDPSLTGKGWGPRLSKQAIAILLKLGAKAVVAHSWRESPHDSSRRYLRGLGFSFVASHPGYWQEVDCVCGRCGEPCECTAEEMILRL
jgi:GNAT superfamily N-acetyltransferase